MAPMDKCTRLVWASICGCILCVLRQKLEHKHTLLGFSLLILRCLRIFMIYLPLLQQETLCSWWHNTSEAQTSIFFLLLNYHCCLSNLVSEWYLLSSPHLLFLFSPPPPSSFSHPHPTKIFLPSLRHFFSHITPDLVRIYDSLYHVDRLVRH